MCKCGTAEQGQELCGMLGTLLLHCHNILLPRHSEDLTDSKAGAIIQNMGFGTYSFGQNWDFFGPFLDLAGAFVVIFMKRKK